MIRAARSIAIAAIVLLGAAPALAQSQAPSGEAAQGETGSGGVGSVSGTSGSGNNGGAGIGAGSPGEHSTSEIGKPEPLAGTTHTGQ